MDTSTKAKLKVHAVEVHDADGNHVRTHLQPGGKYWPDGHGTRLCILSTATADTHGVIHHEVK